MSSPMRHVWGGGVHPVLAFIFVGAEHLGVSAHRQKNGEAEVSLKLKPEHLNSWGAAHGGVILGVFDIVMGLSAISIDDEPSGFLGGGDDPKFSSNGY
jgi:Uncharacterized protein, possibly involved in aromatic compounds catabolism